MKIKILDRFEEEDAVCLLCRTSLRDYVEALSADFKDYYVQRGIVSNRFLDNIWDTIAKKRHIPAIVLVADGPVPIVDVGKTFDFQHGYRILDGLQRSSRLKEAWEAVNFYNSLADDKQLSAVRFTRKYSEELRAREISSPLFQRIIKTSRDGVDVLDLFDKNDLWLEMWFDLSESKQIQKMLVLNAGHKSVNIKHQVELLFMGYLPLLQKSLGDSKIIREKNTSSLVYSKNRKTGEFHFSHLISAFVSLNAGKPITTNADFSASKSFEESEDTDTLLGTDEELLVAFAKLLESLDRSLTSEEGVKWLGREVVLVGIFGAIGAYALKHSCTQNGAIALMQSHIAEFVDGLNLGSFERERNSLDLSKVNLGSINKNAVFQSTLHFLENPTSEPVKWEFYFGVRS